MNNSIYLKLIIFKLFFISTAYCDVMQQELVSQVVSLDFIPEKAYIIVEYQDQSLIQYQALIIPPIKRDNNISNNKDWLLGTYISNNGGSAALGNAALRYSVFLKGKQNENFFQSNINFDDSIRQPYTNSVDLIKQQIASRKQILDSLLVQNETQMGSLKRLRADAEVIANLSRIVEIVEEAEVINLEIENLNKDLELLQATFQAVKHMPPPKNLLRRELELTKQADDLLKLVKTTESNEESRKSLSQREIQEKLKLIEDTRYEDEDKLRQQLIRLKSNSGKVIKEENTGNEVKNYWETQ